MSLFGPPNVDRLKAKGKVKRLVKAIKHRDPEIQHAALLALGEIGGEVAISALISFFKKQRPYDTWTPTTVVTEALVGAGDEAVESIISYINDPNTKRAHRIHAIKILGKIGDSRATETLIEQIDKSGGQAILALGNIGGSNVVSLLINVLRGGQIKINNKYTSNDEHTMVYAIEALGAIGDPKAVKPLIELLKNVDSGIIAIKDKIKFKKKSSRL